MSAYLVNPKIIAVLATFAESKGIARYETVARELSRENIRSLMYRYAIPTSQRAVSEFADIRGGLAGYLRIVDNARDSLAVSFDHVPARVLRDLESFDYQACERNDYAESKAYSFVRAIRDSLV